MMYKILEKTTAIKIVFITAAFLFANVVRGGETVVADEYMKAYSIHDFKKLDELYSNDAIFRDPTSERWPEYAWNMDGKKSILQKMNSYFSKFDNSSATYNVETKYESGGHTVYTGKAKFTKVEKGVLETSCVFITTIISVVDGKVVEHRDYLDYDSWDGSTKTKDQNC